MAARSVENDMIVVVRPWKLLLHAMISALFAAMPLTR